MSELISLEAFNKKMAEAHGIEGKGPEANGIACPVAGCGAELWDSEPVITILTDPPTKAVVCLKCGYQGHRIAKGAK